MCVRHAHNTQDLLHARSSSSPEACVSVCCGVSCAFADVTAGPLVFVNRDHEDEVLDVTFNLSGQLVCTASADGKAFVYDSTTWQVMSTLAGHEGEISKVRQCNIGSGRYLF